MKCKPQTSCCAVIFPGSLYVNIYSLSSPLLQEAQLLLYNHSMILRRLAALSDLQTRRIAGQLNIHYMPKIQHMEQSVYRLYRAVCSHQTPSKNHHASELLRTALQQKGVNSEMEMEVEMVWKEMKPNKEVCQGPWTRSILQKGINSLQIFYYFFCHDFKPESWYTSLIKLINSAIRHSRQQTVWNLCSCVYWIHKFLKFKGHVTGLSQSQELRRPQMKQKLNQIMSTRY